MTPAQIALVQASFARVAPIAPLLADMFYDRVFELAPDIRPLFPDDMAAQKLKLMETLGTVVRFLHQLDTVRPEIEALARRHARHGALPAHYAVVGEALVSTLERALGPSFTADQRAAWRAIYADLAALMIDAAR